MMKIRPEENNIYIMLLNKSLKIRVGGVGVVEGILQ